MDRMTTQLRNYLLECFMININVAIYQEILMLEHPAH